MTGELVMKKMSERISIMILMVMVSFLLQACGSKAEEYKEEPKEGKISVSGKFGLITGELGDRGYNDMHYNGMIEARKRFGIDFEYCEAADPQEAAVMMETLIRNGAATIFVGQGYDNNTVVDSLSLDYPEIRFILIDGLALHQRRNVAAIVFKANEGSFLVGALAALVSRTRKIALVGGEDIPEINNFRIGFEAGARYILPDIELIVDFIGRYDDKISPWFNPERAYTISLDLYRNQDVDLIFPAAGASVLGTFRAANEVKRYAVGVDSDQGYFYPGYILTSMVKNINIAIVMMIKEIVEGRFEAKTYYMGLAENGVGLAPMIQNPEIIPDSVLNRINEIREMILEKKLVVKSIYHE